MIEKKQIRDKIFIDTNILIYAYSIDELDKKTITESLINKYSEMLISTQVVNEFINVMHKKRKIDYKLLSGVLKEFSQIFNIVTISCQTIEQALLLANKYQFSYFDSLILASALENDCAILFSEDMHHNQTILATMKIVNPFRDN